MTLDRLLGTWDVTMRHTAVAEAVQGQLRYERVLEGAFVMQHWTMNHPDFPDAIALLDEQTCHYFDVRGITRTFDLTWTENSWQMIRRDDDFWQRSQATFVDDSRIESTGDNSHDQGTTWEHDYSLTYARAR